MKRELKKSVVYSLYGISFAMLGLGVIAMFSILTKTYTYPVFNYISRGILDYEENVKVVNTTTSIKRPYNDEKVKIVKNFYDYQADKEAQEKSLIYFEGTYMQSSGVAYSSDSTFDIVSILPGKVVEIKEDTTLGNVVTIEHSNGIISTYQSIDDIIVSKDEEISQGQVIAKSSTSNISKDLGNHLYFELIINGACVNPEQYYEKPLSEI